MNYSIWLLIIGMGLVTYIPRMAPFVAVDAEKFPPFLVRLLKNIPYAALGALIFPGILSVHANMWFGVAAGAVAVGIALLRGHLIVVVIGSVAFLTYLHSLS